MSNITNVTDATDETVNFINGITGYLNGFPDWVVAVLIIALSVVLSKVIHFFIERHISKLTSATSIDVDDKIVETIKTPLYYTIILIGFLVASGYIKLPYYESFSVFIIIILIITAAYVVAKVIEILLEDFSERVLKKEKVEEVRSTIDVEAVPFIIRMAKLVIFIIAFLIIFQRLFNIDVESIIVGLGLFSVGIGFAAKDTFANLFAGFFILFDRPFVRGERIEIQGQVGEVVDIGLRTTKIKTLADKIVIIPNALMVSDLVINYALPRSKIQLREIYGVAYGSDVEKVIKILLEAADECDYIYKKPKPEVLFVKFNDYSLDFELRVWIKDYRENRARGAINPIIDRKFREQGIEIPFPVRTIYMGEERNYGNDNDKNNEDKKGNNKNDNNKNGKEKK